MLFVELIGKKTIGLLPRRFGLVERDISVFFQGNSVIAVAGKDSNAYTGARDDLRVVQ